MYVKKMLLFLTSGILKDINFIYISVVTINSKEYRL